MEIHDVVSMPRVCPSRDADCSAFSRVRVALKALEVRNIAIVAVQSVVVLTFAFALPWLMDFMLNSSDLAFYRIAVGIEEVDFAQWVWLGYVIPVIALLYLALCLAKSVAVLFGGEKCIHMMDCIGMRVFRAVLFWLSSLGLAFEIILHVLARAFIALASYRYGSLDNALVFGEGAGTLAWCFGAITLSILACIALCVLPDKYTSKNVFSRMAKFMRSKPMARWFMLTMTVIVVTIALPVLLLMAGLAAALAAGLVFGFFLLAALIVMLPSFIAVAFRSC